MECNLCGTESHERTCAECGKVCEVIDCAHARRPLAIDVGREDGTDTHLLLCTRCARIPFDEDRPLDIQESIGRLVSDTRAPWLRSIGMRS